MTNLSGLQKRAIEIRQKYNVLNSVDGHKKWDGTDYASGFVGDVGDLVKLIMAKENKRHGPGDIDAALSHELSDCLWSILVIANYYGINLEEAFMKTMDELDERTAV